MVNCKLLVVYCGLGVAECYTSQWKIIYTWKTNKMLVEHGKFLCSDCLFTDKNLNSCEVFSFLAVEYNEKLIYAKFSY